MLRRPNPTAAPVPLTVADDRVDRDRVPPQTAAMMEGAAQLLTDGLVGSALLGAKPSPMPDHASVWRPFEAAAGVGVVRDRTGWGPSGVARGAFLSRACSGWLGSEPPSMDLSQLGCMLLRSWQALIAGSLNHPPGGRGISSTPLQHRQPPPLHWLGFGCGVGWEPPVLSDACPHWEVWSADTRENNEGDDDDCG